MAVNTFSISGAPIQTDSETQGDSASTLPNDYLYHDGNTTGKKATFALISIEDFPIRWATGGTPTHDGGTGLGHAAFPGDIIILEGQEAVFGFKSVNKIQGSNAIIQISTHYA